MAPDIQLQLLASLEDGVTGIGLFDPHDRLRYANRFFLKAYATTLDQAPTWEEMLRRCHRDQVGLLIKTDDMDAWLARVRRSYRQVPVRSFESDLTDGRWMRVTETLHANGWVLDVTTDVTALKVNETTLQHARDKAVLLSVTDPLTGIYNRRYVFDRLGELLASARNMRYPLTLVAMDLDHFKRINDVHGHSVGDQVLVQFALQLQQHLRPQDVVGRIGGEEFLMVLPNTDIHGAQQVLLRLRSSLADSQPVRHLPALQHNFSSGLASALSADTVETLYVRADRALYLAKAAGRGRDHAVDDSSTPADFAV